MTSIPDRQAIIAIEPTPRGLAYVLFENGALADWGQPECGGGETVLLRRLFETFGADLLVLEDPDAPGCRRRPRVKSLLRRLAASARQLRVVVRAVQREAVRESWRRRGFQNKQAIAAVLGDAFYELQPYVPPLRKVFMSEDARIKLFDALSMLLHALRVSPEDIAP